MVRAVNTQFYWGNYIPTLIAFDRLPTRPKPVPVTAIGSEELGYCAFPRDGLLRRNGRSCGSLRRGGNFWLLSRVRGYRHG